MLVHPRINHLDNFSQRTKRIPDMLYVLITTENLDFRQLSIGMNVTIESLCTESAEFSSLM